MPAPRRKAGVPIGQGDANGRGAARQNDRPCPVPLQVRTKVWLEREGAFVIGDGGLRLLQEIERRGSLLAAARQIGWSYRHAWQYLRRAEEVCGYPLVVPRPGKGLRRGTDLTADGSNLLTVLRAARKRVDRSVGVTGPTNDEIAVRGRHSAQRAAREGNSSPR